MEEVHKKNFDIVVHTLMSILTSNMKVTKIGQNTSYAHFEGFWSPSYVTSKLTSISVNLIMSIFFFFFFFLNLLHNPCV